MEIIFKNRKHDSLTTEEADALVHDLLALRAKVQENPSLKRSLDQLEAKCVKSFAYIVAMHTAKYKNFFNYDDLNQDGLEALTRALKSYQPGAGNIFWWCHHYVETKISRRANTHTTIRFPLRKAKEIAPQRESIRDTTKFDINDPVMTHDRVELMDGVRKIVSKLESDQQREAITDYFGLNGSSKNIDQIAKEQGITKSRCLRQLRKNLKSLIA
jgi:RNA polymerase sigma factor (sigma-70 family)